MVGENSTSSAIIVKVAQKFEIWRNYSISGAIISKAAQLSKNWLDYAGRAAAPPAERGELLKKRLYFKPLKRKKWITMNLFLKKSG
jgi:hypothetical protein